MSNKCSHEDSGLVYKKSCYTPLDKTWKYSCPHRNNTYRGFSNGINCLCNVQEKTSFDKMVDSGKQWPTGNPNLGWKY